MIDFFSFHLNFWKSDKNSITGSKHFFKNGMLEKGSSLMNGVWIGDMCAWTWDGQTMVRLRRIIKMELLGLTWLLDTWATHLSRGGYDQTIDEDV